MGKKEDELKALQAALRQGNLARNHLERVSQRLTSELEGNITAHAAIKDSWGKATSKNEELEQNLANPQGGSQQEDIFLRARTATNQSKR